MTLEEFCDHINYSGKAPAERKSIAQDIIDDPELVSYCFQLIKNKHSKSSRAAMLLEMACKRQLSIIFSFLDDFLETIPFLKTHGAKRSFAKMAELLSFYHFTQKSKIFSQQHKKQLTEHAFDWLINDNKTATQAHAMTILLLLGMEAEWIHTELKALINKDMHHKSAGFQARGRNTLRSIDQFYKSKNSIKI